MKKMFLALFAIITTLGLYAFSVKEAVSVKETTGTTYVYTGSSLPDDQRDPTLYIKDNEAVPCQSGIDVICQIVTGTDQGLNPDFSNGNPFDNPEMFVDVSKRAN